MKFRTLRRKPESLRTTSIQPRMGSGKRPRRTSGRNDNFESTMGGLGGQPANFVSGVPVSGTGDYYYKDSSIVGLVSTEDMVVMMDEMGIETNLDIDKILDIGIW